MQHIAQLVEALPRHYTLRSLVAEAEARLRGTPPRLDVVRGADAEADEQTNEILQLDEAGVAAGVREQAFGSSVRIRVPDDFHQELVRKQQPKELSCARGIT
jgi:hypothetical protein